MGRLELLPCIKLAQKMDASPLNVVDFGDVQFVDGRICANENSRRSAAVEEVLGTNGGATVEAKTSAQPGQHAGVLDALAQRGIYGGESG